MAFYASCWLITESYLIPDGLVKWFYLSFYIHPFLLIHCQLFLWLKALKEFFSIILFLLLNTVRFLFVYMYNCVIAAPVYCFSFIRIRSCHLHSTEIFEPAEYSDDYQVFRSFSLFCQAAAVTELKVVSTHTIVYEDPDEKEYGEALPDFDVFDREEQRPDPDIDMNMNENNSCSSACSSNLPSVRELLSPDETVNKEDDTDSTTSIVMWSWPESLAQDGNTSYSIEEEESEPDLNEYNPSPYEHISLPDMGVNEDLTSHYTTDFYCSELEWPEHDEPTVDFGPNAAFLVREEPNMRESDLFYGKYCERMRWFDVLSYERTCGTGVILESKFELATISGPFWGDKTAKKRLLKSLESDLELAYVAQMCLSWEALHHQYRKVDKLLTSSCPRISISGHMKLVGEFQNFQVLIDRFLEEESRGDKRYLKFLHGRFSVKNLLQVPELSGFSEEEEEQKGRENGTVLELKKAAEVMEKCIKAFYTFVETDKDKSWWKLKRSLWSYHLVEDPRDLQLLHDLTKTHGKKVLLLKDLLGKRKCWIKHGGSTDHAEDSQRKEISFTMIDLKLVSRVLKMAIISSSHLKWCQTKIDNITFREGKVVRGCTCPLFPVS